MLVGIVHYRKGIEMNMKEFKKWFQKEKIKYPYRPPNEIDCGMSWKAALEFVQGLYKKYDFEDWDTVACNIKEDIEKELKNE